MNFYIIIPAFNEEAHLAKTLQSLVEQSLLPKKIIAVNDNSTDNTQSIIDTFTEKHTIIKSITTQAEAFHAPGSKVINAFYKGFETLDNDYDVICKFDADLIFPTNYLETIANTFRKNKDCGMAGGFCYIEKNKKWVLENLTNKDHIRGAIKAYKKECFQQINGIKNTMGWDTVDELLAQYHGWQICTNESLHVKHLKLTGATYNKVSRLKQGRAFKKMRYGFCLTVIASAKLSVKKRSLSYFFNCLQGYFSLKKTYIVTSEEGKFIRKLRWKGIKRKLF